MQQGLLVKFSCNFPIRYLIAHWRALLVVRSFVLEWRVVATTSCMSHIINIVNACINLGHWPNHFKRSSTVIIPKPNKTAYDSPKSFWPIVLLNTIRKLIEKVIAECLQFHVAKNDFIHPSQLGSLKFKSTTDAGVTLTHIIQSGWIKNKTTSILAFDIA